MKSIFTYLMLCLPLLGFADDTILPPPPSEPDGAIAGHEYVDLGLPSGTLWATCNIGTSSPYETGPYFAWAEVEPKDIFSWFNYAYYEDYVIHDYLGAWVVTTDLGTKNICGTQYDVAAQLWGNGWRMPNDQERYELMRYCWSKWVKENGVRGVRVYGYNEHNIFLPACGWGALDDTGPSEIGIAGGYWTGHEDPENTLDPNIPVDPSSMAMCIYVDSSGLCASPAYKFGGKNIRAVINPKEAGITTLNDGSLLAISYCDGSLKIDGNISSCNLSIHDLSGRTVFTGMIKDRTCQLPNLSGGMYIVSLFNGNSIIKVQKIHIN